MSGNESFKLSSKAQLGVIDFMKSCKAMYRENFMLRERFRQIDLAYIREQDLTEEQVRAKLANTYGDSNKLQNITIPIVLPQVESAVAYQTSVFLTGIPIFGCVSSSEHIDAAMQLEAKIDDDSTKGAWVSKLSMAFRDAFKYNLGAIEVAWQSKVVPTLVTDLAFDSVQAKPTDTIWTGNALRRLDPYNLFWDTRVSVEDVPAKGEFAGYSEVMSRIALKELIASLDEPLIENIKPAFESGYVDSFNTEDYYIPQLNSSAYQQLNTKATTNWQAWFQGTNDASKHIEYKNSYLVTTIYGRILPSDFGLRVPQPNTPQVWKFIIINNSVIIHAERQTNAHKLIPILFMQTVVDGLGYQSKSTAENIVPLQQVSSALMNSVIAARRRAIYDRNVYDPSKIAPSDINSSNPIHNIPVKPSAYGSDLRTAFVPFTFRDDQSGTALQEIAQIDSLANNITGQNKAQQGQFVKGNKTRAEYSDIMGNANSRSQTISVLLEAQFFSPLKQILKLNILQYQGGTTVYSRGSGKSVTIDPLVLREADIEFKLSDGLTPSEKLLNLPAYQTAMQVIGSSPQLAGAYNLAGLFSYLLKSQGADIGDFEKSKEQLAYEQAAAQWQQVAMMYAEKGGQFNQPQPLPEQFGYYPNGNKPDGNSVKQKEPTVLEQFMATEADSTNKEGM